MEIVLQPLKFKQFLEIFSVFLRILTIDFSQHLSLPPEKKLLVRIH